MRIHWRWHVWSNCSSCLISFTSLFYQKQYIFHFLYFCLAALFPSTSNPFRNSHKHFDFMTLLSKVLKKHVRRYICFFQSLLIILKIPICIVSAKKYWNTFSQERINCSSTINTAEAVQCCTVPGFRSGSIIEQLIRYQQCKVAVFVRVGFY